MIELTKYEKTYEASLKELFLEEGLDFKEISLCLDTTYVVIEREEVLGFAYYNLYDHDIFLDHLFVKPSQRLNYFGDSLFRTVLNALQLQGVQHVFMRQDNRYDFFLKKEGIFLENNQYKIDLHEFFNRNCKGSKEVEHH